MSAAVRRCVVYNPKILTESGNRLIRIMVKRPRGDRSVITAKIEKQVAQIEETQSALRDSIDQTKALAEKADKLIQSHKDTLKKELPG